MRRFLPLILASSILALGSGTILVKFGGVNLTGLMDTWTAGPEARATLETEQDRRSTLGIQMNEVGRRLSTRIETCRLLIAKKIEMAEAFEIYYELNLEARDPLHPEDGWRSERERFDWIGQQIATNVESVLTGAHTEQEDRERVAVLVRLQWLMVEAEG